MSRSEPQPQETNINRETLIQEWIRLRAELETVERRIAGTFEKSEPVGDLFDNPTGKTRTRAIPGDTRPAPTQKLVLAYLRGRVPMTAREIAWQFRDASAHTMRAILRRLVKRGVVMRSTGSHGIAVFELIHRA